MSNKDPIRRVIASEFAIYQGRAQHRMTYDTGHKGHDGAGADMEHRPRRTDRLGAPTNQMIVEWTPDGDIVVNFEDLS